ncbi:MAG TPA: hypothetical protein VFV49_14265, partial [Thermoanaerobaculia bacterium]|nr:hypothetical protein [Thermoanaerobaculia bacterium]
MRASRLLKIAALSAVLSSSGAAQTDIPVQQFRSIELHHGGTVIVRHGPAQRVTIRTGDLRSTRVRLATGQRLVIENCNPDCPRNYRLQMEIITPELSA